MTKEEVKQELEKYLEHEVTEDFLHKCINAYNNGRHGPAGLGGMAVLGYFVPFEKVLNYVFYKDYPSSWPCGEAIHLAMFFRQKNEKGDAIRECLFGTKEINYK